jgi:hypothetical protein
MRWPFYLLRSKDRSLRQLLQAEIDIPAGAAEGCDLLIFSPPVSLSTRFVHSLKHLHYRHKKTGYISRFFYVRKKLMHVFMGFIILRNM